MSKAYTIKTFPQGMLALDLKKGISACIYDKPDYLNISLFNCNRDYFRLSLPRECKDKIKIVYH